MSLPTTIDERYPNSAMRLNKSVRKRKVTSPLGCLTLHSLAMKTLRFHLHSLHQESAPTYLRSVNGFCPALHSQTL